VIRAYARLLNEQGDTPMPANFGTISVINESTVCADDQVAAWVKAVQDQVTQDFAPLWGTTAQLVFVPKSGTPDPKASWIAVLDDADAAGVLGYHDLTDAGLPLGKVFARTTLQYNDQVSVVLSHETLELLADPSINRIAKIRGRNWAVEVADATEDDAYGYERDGVLLSDFVSPRYFGLATTGPFDFRRLLRAPCPHMLPGGYLSFETPDGQWQQIFGAEPADARAAYKARPLHGSRRHRRQIGAENWIKSARLS
jgi:hypothetical protein